MNVFFYFDQNVIAVSVVVFYYIKNEKSIQPHIINYQSRESSSNLIVPRDDERYEAKISYTKIR